MPSLRSEACYGSCMRFAVVFLLGLLVLAGPNSAHANGRFPSSNQISFHPTDPNVFVTRTTFGLLVTRDDGDNFHWICEQLLQTRMLEDPALLVMGDSSTLVSLFIGQRRGTPDDCTWDFVSPDLQNRVVIDSIGDPSNPAAAWIVTSDGARPNAVWRTTDNGVTWAKLTDDFENVLFETIEVAPSNTQRMYLTGAIPPTSMMARQTFVFRSDDGGASWDQFPFNLETGTQIDLNIYLASVDPVDPDRVYMRVRGSPNDKLVVSEDGGETFHKVISFSGMLGFARSPDGQHLWVGGDHGTLEPGLFRSDDRGENFDPVSGMVMLGDGTTPPIPLRIGCLAVRGNELWACANNFADQFTLGYSLDQGSTFAPVLRFDEIQGPPPACGSSTEVQQSCASQYPILVTTIGIDAGIDEGYDAGRQDAGPLEMDAGPPPATTPPSGCSCDMVTSRSRDGWWTAAVGSAILLALIYRARVSRRSRRAEPSV